METAPRLIFRVLHYASATRAAVETCPFRFPIGSPAGMIAVGTPRSVVGRENYQGVFFDAGRLQRLGDLAD